jgi:Uma2 family endonuclease
MSLHEIVLPETKPETEWVRGRPLQKTGGTYRHGLLQVLLATALMEWAEEANRGRVGIEWRFRVRPPNEPARPLVPDAAYLSYDALPAGAPRDAVAVPLMAPTVAVEILSPDDRDIDVLDKVATYLAGGCRAIVIVDPDTEQVTAHDRDGEHKVAGPTFQHPALPGFSLDLQALFERARR